MCQMYGSLLCFGGEVVRLEIVGGLKEMEGGGEGVR